MGSLNILSLIGERVPYNSCRTLEWQVCAALGKLPGQRSRKILFATAPGSLDPGPKSRQPFGQCGGRHGELRGDDCKQGGFGSVDVYARAIRMLCLPCAASLWRGPQLTLAHGRAPRCRRFYLELCIYNQICANGAELFQLARGKSWECQLSAARLVRLKEMLMAEPDWGPPHGGSK